MPHENPQNFGNRAAHGKGILYLITGVELVVFTIREYFIHYIGTLDAHSLIYFESFLVSHISYLINPMSVESLNIVNNKFLKLKCFILYYNSYKYPSKAPNKKKISVSTLSEAEFFADG